MTCKRGGACTQVIPFFAEFDFHLGTHTDNIKDKEEHEWDRLIACLGQILDLISPDVPVQVLL